MKWKKLHDDLLLETEGKRKGKYSKKSVIMISSFLMAVFSGTYILFAHLFNERATDPNSIYVFYGFLTGAGVVVHFSVKDKKNHMMHENNDNEIIG